MENWEIPLFFNNMCMFVYERLLVMELDQKGLLVRGTKQDRQNNGTYKSPGGNNGEGVNWRIPTICLHLPRISRGMASSSLTVRILVSLLFKIYSSECCAPFGK